ncbi:MAG: glycosyltransferase family 2 protein [Chloroflexi bacterium]|nr:glycosyltransferase family 2 protein [Chloroflexota bacterium]
MKLVINIPCLNEEQTLPLVLRELPQALSGVDEIEIQVVDDGSTDRTAGVAREFGCRVIQHKRHLGLGRAFNTAVWGALEAGADIMVNTDADNQYPGRYIEELIQPILHGDADIVIGDRRPGNVVYFSWVKRLMQRIGNWLVQWLVGGYVPDSVSGFRAYSANALLNLNVYTRYSYTLDSLAQASRKGLLVTWVPIQTNAPTRPSRLFRNIWGHMLQSGFNLMTVFVIYEPFLFFFFTSMLFAGPANILAVRFLYFYFLGQGSGHIQSLIFAAVGFTLAGLLFVLGVLGHLIGHLRRLLEDIYSLQKTQFLSKNEY